MNDLVSQLLQLGPGIAAGVKGNGGGMQAFMESYQRTMAQLEEQERRKRQDQFSIEDRQRQIARQDTADTRQTDIYNRGIEQQNQADALQRMQIPGQLAQMGGAMESPDDAKHLIETVLPGLMDAFGQDTMAFGQPAVEMATQTITARQKRQVSEFVEKALKTSFVADNPDADPEIQNLPPHLVKVIGKPSAKLSELQSFAELPVGKPQGKERMPAASGSMEEFSDPNVTPERKAQILADRKAYMQSDDRPRVDVNVNGGLNPNQSALLTERLAKNWQDVTAPSREMNRQFGLMETGLNRFRAGDKNGGSQAVLVTFQKILDPTSVVRESEYARSAQGVSMMARLQGYADRLAAGGAGVPEAELAQMVETARQMKNQTQTYASSMRSRIEAVTKKNQIDPVTVFGVETPVESAAPQTPTFKIDQKVRNKKTGEIRVVTGVRPDGSPILGPVVKE